MTALLKGPSPSLKGLVSKTTCMQVAVLFALSRRLGPILAGVIISTAATAALYKQQTKAIEADAAKANSAMVSVASQTFGAITTVRCFSSCIFAFAFHSYKLLVIPSCKPLLTSTLFHIIVTSCRSFAGEPLERERFNAYVMQSFRSGVGFGAAKANLESLNRQGHLQAATLMVHVSYDLG